MILPRLNGHVFHAAYGSYSTVEQSLMEYTDFSIIVYKRVSLLIPFT
jgi:hypothetical protein